MSKYRTEKIDIMALHAPALGEDVKKRHLELLKVLRDSYPDNGTKNGFHFKAEKPYPITYEGEQIEVKLTTDLIKIIKTNSDPGHPQYNLLVLDQKRDPMRSGHYGSFFKNIPYFSTQDGELVPKKFTNKSKSCLGIKAIKREDLSVSSNTNTPAEEVYFNWKTGSSLHVKKQAVTTEDGKYSFVIMRAADEDLHSLRRRMLDTKYENFSALEIVKIMFGIVAEYIKRIYKNDVVHRDIKLENIFYKEDKGSYRIYIGDFGLSTFNGCFSACAGSPDTIAPELLDEPTRINKGKKQYLITKNHDLYSLGIVLRELLGYVGNGEEVDSEDKLCGIVFYSMRECIIKSLLNNKDERLRYKGAENLGKKFNNHEVFNLIHSASDTLTKEEPEERNIRDSVKNIGKALIKLDPENKDVYSKEIEELLSICEESKLSFSSFFAKSENSYVSPSPSQREESLTTPQDEYDTRFVEVRQSFP